MLSEATAGDVLPRHAMRLLDGRPGRAPRAGEAGACRLLVASSNSELCRTVAEACTAAGYHVEQADDQIVGETSRLRGTSEPSTAAHAIITVWDVPVLEEWTERLERHARNSGPVVALMGFPDRHSVALAKSKGAVACLELPLNLDDLVDVIDRATQPAASETRP